MNVVVFGPKFWKKFARQYKNTNAPLGPELAVSLSYPKPAHRSAHAAERIEEGGRTHDDEEDREHGETHELDRLAAPLVDHLLDDLVTLGVRVVVGDGLAAGLGDFLDHNIGSLLVLVLGGRAEIVYENLCAARSKKERVSAMVDVRTDKATDKRLKNMKRSTSVQSFPC